MRAVCVVCVAAACGAGFNRPDTRVVARDALTKAAHDVDAMTRLLRGGVVNGGLWFDDPACAAKFPVGEIDPKLTPELARCLVGLKLEPSPREDTLAEVVVMTYAPGFQIAARVARAADGPRLTWIGYGARRETDTLPTISADAFEGLRTAGERDGPLDQSTITLLENEPISADADRVVTMTWLRVCIDEQGGVTSADPYLTTSLVAETGFVAAAKTWRFRPFVVRDRAVAVCAMSRLVYPPGSGTQPETIPMPPPKSRSNKRPIVLASSKLIEGKRISGTAALGPDDKTKFEMYQSGLTDVEGSFRVCLDDAGAVESVLPLRSTGFPSYDTRLIAGMREWRYTPYEVADQSVPVCTFVTFKYHQDNNAKSRR